MHVLVGLECNACPCRLVGCNACPGLLPLVRLQCMSWLVLVGSVAMHVLVGPSWSMHVLVGCWLVDMEMHSEYFDVV